MAFNLPSFNLTFDYWSPGVAPNSAPADGQILGQLYVHSRNNTDLRVAVAQIETPSVYIRLPIAAWFGATTLGVNAFLAWTNTYRTYWYRVRWWEITHAGFANQYVSALVEQCLDDGTFPDTTR